MIKLSIGIPVFNGAETLAETLKSVFYDLPQGVEVLISDNASSDNTAQIVKSFRIKHPELNYYKNSQNLGPDANFDLVVKRAAGEFVWILGDDDEIAKNGIRAVMNVIDSNAKIDAIFVNYSIYDRDTNECINPRALKIEKDVFCVNANAFLNTATVYPNFVSSIVVRKSKWLMNSSKEFLGSYWIQYGMLMKVIEGGQSFCMAAPYVINRGKEYEGPNEANRNGAAISVLLNLVDLVDALPNSIFTKASIAKTRREAHKFLLRKIFGAKRRGLDLNRALLLRMIGAFKMYPSFWLVELPLLFAPKEFHSGVWRIYKSRGVREIVKTFRA